MITILFEPQEKHLDHGWYGMFTEDWKDQGTLKHQIGSPWRFDLEESDVGAINQLCHKYQIEELQQEALCLFFKMKSAVSETASNFSREQWDEIKGRLGYFERWLDSSKFDKIFAADQLESIKVKQKDAKLSILYEGILLDFIRQAVVEKYERDREKLKPFQQSTLQLILATKEKKPVKLREREREKEEALAYHIFKFFKSESRLNQTLRQTLMTTWWIFVNGGIRTKII